MRVVVVGATGNVGTSLVRALSLDPAVDEILGIARRVPTWELDKVSWVSADVSWSPLERYFRGAGAVVHLAWLIQPSRRVDIIAATNVEGSKRVFDAVGATGVPALIYASSVGAYSPGPKDRTVDETWPTEGIATSFYSRHKAAVERLLDRFEADHPDTRVVRMRPALIFKREAATDIRRLFLGPLAPTRLLRPQLIRLVPDVPGFGVQAVHTEDVAEAYRLAVHNHHRGAFNLAADPVLDSEELARVFGARRVPAPPKLLRFLADLSWRARLQPTPPGWIDLALGVPLLDTTRARERLGWQPRTTAAEALLDLLDGLAGGARGPTPPLGARAR